MSDYLDGNHSYWSKGYEAENVESFVFRPYGRILKHEFGLTGEQNERVLDFACGQGAAMRFFKSKGFDVYGVDISEPDIRRCRELMPDISEHFAVIPPKPGISDVFFGGDFHLVTAIQSLYYLSAEDLKIRLRSLFDQMKPGALIFATMMGTRHYFYEHSKEYGSGLRRVEFSNSRLQVSDYFVNFTETEDELVDKFGLFERLHVGFYAARYREDEGSSFHFTFIGRKPA